MERILRILNGSLIALVAIVMVSTPAMAQYRSVVPIRSSTDDSVDFVVGTEGKVYTKSIWTRGVGDEKIGVMYKAASVGTVAINIYIEQSYGFPSTEGSQDATFVPTTEVVTGLADENWHVATVDSVVLPVSRFVVVGGKTNDSSTMMQIKVGKF